MPYFSRETTMSVAYSQPTAECIELMHHQAKSYRTSLLSEVTAEPTVLSMKIEA
jgi:hypothetical protein